MNNQTSNNQTSNIDIDLIIDIILRRRWFIIIPLTVALIAGLYLSVTLPKIYESRTLILVEPQRVPTNYVQSLVSVDIDARISTISQQILSRTNLENIIDQFQLFREPGMENMYLEDKLESLRKRIDVNVTRARRGADAFSIKFKGKDPEKVMKVANALATFFINENLKVREAQAIGTSDFLDGELDSMRKRLEAVELQMKNYREKYMGELPEQLETNLNILDRLQEQLNDREAQLRESKNSLLIIEDQIRAGGRRVVPQPGQETGPVVTGVNDDAIRLEQMREQLDHFRSKYTEKHPDIIRLRKALKELEEKLTSELSAGKSDEGGAPSSAGSFVDPALSGRRADIKHEISRLNAEIRDLQKQIAMYSLRVENTPKREQELLSLRRDYQNIQNSYDSLLSRKLEAQIAVNMERKQKGEQFRILDSAKVPARPIAPNIMKLLVFSFAGGAAVAGGIIFLLEFMSTTFRRPDDIEKELDLPVLATIPAISKTGDKIKKRLNLVFSCLFSTFAAVLFACFGLFAVKGVDQTIAVARKIIGV